MVAAAERNGGCVLIGEERPREGGIGQKVDEIEFVGIIPRMAGSRLVQTLMVGEGAHVADLQNAIKRLVRCGLPRAREQDHERDAAMHIPKDRKPYGHESPEHEEEKRVQCNRSGLSSGPPLLEGTKNP